MPFNPSEKQVLLAVKGVGPTILLRFEQLGYHSLADLAAAETAGIVQEVSSMLGASCWKNSPQARAAAQGAIDAAIAHGAKN